jgi:hypothetical protein
MSHLLHTLRNLTRPHDPPTYEVQLFGCEVLMLVLLVEPLLRRNRIEGEHAIHVHTGLMALKEPFPDRAITCDCQPRSFYLTEAELRGLREGINSRCAIMGEDIGQLNDAWQNLLTGQYEDLRKVYVKLRLPVGSG